MQIGALKDLVVHTLNEMKANDVQVLDVRERTSIADFLVVASGTSGRHVKSIAEAVAFKAKQAGELVVGQEGLQEGEWALVDLNNIIVHVMQPKVRNYYQIEQLWGVNSHPIIEAQS